MLVERVASFVRGESEESFDELALEVFRAGYAADAAFRKHCERRGARPDEVSDWRRAPPLPAAAGAQPAPGEGAPEGKPADKTAAAEPAARDLRHAVVDRSFPAACLAGLERPPVLALAPSGPDGSGVVDWILAAWAAPDSAVALRRRGVDVARARGFLAARQRDRRPTVILAAAAALAQLLEALARRGLRFRLPAGSRVVETAARRPGDRDLPARLAEGLGLPPEGLVREYAAGGLPSRFYAGHAADGQARPFAPPPWTRVRILDPETLEEVPPGVAGSIAAFDLAAVGGAPYVLTGERGVAGAEGFRLVGR